MAKDQRVQFTEKQMADIVQQAQRELAGREAAVLAEEARCSPPLSQQEMIERAKAGIENNISSRYGEATGQMVGLGAQLAATTHRDPQKTFTRAEVMTVIRAAKADEPDPSGPGRAALERLRRIFERME